MIATIIAINVIGFMFLYVLVFRLVKKTSYYRGLRELYKQARRAPVRVTSKGDLRRLRKTKPYLKVFRKRLTLLMLINMAIFMAVYTAMIFTTLYIVVGYFEGGLVTESPLMIPFFTTVDLETGKIYVYTYAIVFVAFMATLYPVTREMKIHES